MSFPAWRYHKTHAPKIINTPDEATHEDGWRDTPAAFLPGAEPDNGADIVVPEGKHLLTHDGKPEPAAALEYAAFEAPAKKTKKSKE